MCHLVLCFVTWFLNHFMHGTHFSLLHIDVAKNARPAECWVILCARHEDYVGYSKHERKVTKYQVKLTRHKHGVNQTIKAHCWCNRFLSDLFSLLSKKTHNMLVCFLVCSILEYFAYIRFICHNLWPEVADGDVIQLPRSWTTGQYMYCDF